MSVLGSLLTGLDDNTRSRTVEMIAQNVAEERDLATSDGPLRRAHDVGSRTRRSGGSRSHSDSADGQ